MLTQLQITKSNKITIKKVAANKVAFTVTDKSIGTWVLNQKLE